MTARQIAFAVLEKTERGGHASELIAELTVGVLPREAGLAMTIAMGVLRFRGQLDHFIARCSSKPISKLDSEVRTALRMGVYQLRYMDRIPPHAAVGESVNLVRGARKNSATGFVNAVLRNIQSESLAWPSLAAELSLPAWLLTKWETDFGREAAAAIAGAALEIPRTFIRVPRGVEPPSEARATEVPGCYEMDAPGNGFRVQDIGSQAIVPLLSIEPGISFLDVCAPPGNKTAQALELKPRWALACDISPRRLHLLANLHISRLVCNAELPFPLSAHFDRILVDVPCSGTGTLGHNPEIKWRLTPEALASFPPRQKRILANALDRLAPGGTLVYSTCSLEKEENEEVVHVVCSSRIVREFRRTPGLEAGDGFYAAVIA